jgi:hypothetical protein
MVTLLVTTAAAFVPFHDGWGWQEEPVVHPLTVDVDSFPAGFAAEGELEAAVREVTAIYNLTSESALHLAFGGVATGGSEEIRVVYVPTTPGGAVGINGSLFDANGIVACEVEIFGANAGGPIDWYTGLDPAGIGPDDTDLISVLLHEVGHCLGLDHTPVQEAVMAAAQLSGSVVREFHEDDIAGFQFLYGELEIALEVSDFTVTEDDGDGVLGREERAVVTFDLANTGNARTLEVDVVVESLVEGVDGEALTLPTLRHVDAPTTVELVIDADDTCRAREESVDVVVTTARGVSVVAGSVPVDCKRGALGCTTTPTNGFPLAWWSRRR